MMQQWRDDDDRYPIWPIVIVVGLILVIIIGAMLAGCAPTPLNGTTPNPSTMSSPRATTPHASGASDPRRAASWPAPNQRLTPGAVVACTLPRPQSQRAVTAAEKDQIAAAYHYSGPRGLTHLEFDHRVPFALCGANDARNVWPEPYDGVRQSAFVHNYKDQIEAAVIRAVHAGALTLAQGQAIFYGDWRQAWCVWVHTAGVTC